MIDASTGGDLTGVRFQAQVIFNLAETFQGRQVLAEPARLSLSIELTGIATATAATLGIYRKSTCTGAVVHFDHHFVPGVCGGLHMCGLEP